MSMPVDTFIAPFDAHPERLEGGDLWEERAAHGEQRQAALLDGAPCLGSLPGRRAARRFDRLLQRVRQDLDERAADRVWTRPSTLAR